MKHADDSDFRQLISEGWVFTHKLQIIKPLFNIIGSIEMNKTFLIVISVLIFSAINFGEASAIDADSWENIFRVRLGMKKGMKATEMLKNVLGEEINNKKNATVVFDKVNNVATVTLKTPYKDIVSLRAKQTVNRGTVDFSLNYTFKQNSMLLLDILGRYGSICDVQTDAEMGRLINIFIHRNTELSSDHPLNMFLPLNKKEYIALRFIGPDRVHVSELMYLYEKIDDSPPKATAESFPDAAPVAG